MKLTAMSLGIFHSVFGILFTFFAIQNVQINGEWGLFTYLLVLLATSEIGSGIRLFQIHFKQKSIEKTKK